MSIYDMYIQIPLRNPKERPNAIKLLNHVFVSVSKPQISTPNSMGPSTPFTHRTTPSSSPKIRSRSNSISNNNSPTNSAVSSPRSGISLKKSAQINNAAIEPHVADVPSAPASKIQTTTNEARPTTPVTVPREMLTSSENLMEEPTWAWEGKDSKRGSKELSWIGTIKREKNGTPTTSNNNTIASSGSISEEDIEIIDRKNHILENSITSGLTFPPLTSNSNHDRQRNFYTSTASNPIQIEEKKILPALILPTPSTSSITPILSPSSPTTTQKALNRSGGHPLPVLWQEQAKRKGDTAPPPTPEKGIVLFDKAVDEVTLHNFVRRQSLKGTKLLARGPMLQVFSFHIHLY
jgi:hypothetical protein